MILTKILRTLLLVAMAACMGSPGGASAQLSTEPILRIEAGAHLSLVTRVSTDAQGRWIVSASEDKTARVWDATTGRLLSVLRPPVGPESVGALYAAVLSPDGKQVALGGNAAFDGKSHSLYLFDRSTGRLPRKAPYPVWKRR
jgi:WD40 repeat protein